MKTLSNSLIKELYILDTKMTLSDEKKRHVSGMELAHLTDCDQVRLLMYGINQIALKGEIVTTSHQKVIKHALQFKTTETLRRIYNRGGSSIKAFTQAACASDFIIGPNNSAHIAAADLIGPRLLEEISKLTSTVDEEKVKRDALQKIILIIFLGRSTSNGRDLCASTVKKDTSQTLESLVTICGKLNKWLRSKGMPAPYDPRKS